MKGRIQTAIGDSALGERSPVATNLVSNFNAEFETLNVDNFRQCFDLMAGAESAVDQDNEDPHQKLDRSELKQDCEPTQELDISPQSEISEPRIYLHQQISSGAELTISP